MKNISLRKQRTIAQEYEEKNQTGRCEDYVDTPLAKRPRAARKHVEVP